MIPLHDQNPTRTLPVVTLLLIAACVAVYFLVQPNAQVRVVEADPQEEQVRQLRFNLERAAVPQELTTGRPLTDDEVADTFPTDGIPSSAFLCPANEEPACYPDKSPWLSILYSMFLHGSVMHLAGNMLFLWVFGNNIEDRRGRVTYIAFYVLAGVAATFAQVLVDPGSTIPMIGASGAVAGVMGAYLVLYPNVRIHTLIIFGIILFRDIAAKWLLGLWFVSQFFIAPNSGVASMAHVGGFVFGAVAGLVWRLLGERGERSRDLVGFGDDR
ncbi:MAG: rhomboid family intramembrane serine protease [Actinomycetota bacterium]|nr:rhomboid family intramembrane serine protease [Actinomycetota bacterium]